MVRQRYLVFVVTESVGSGIFESVQALAKVLQCGLMKWQDPSKYQAMCSGEGKGEMYAFFLYLLFH